MSQRSVAYGASVGRCTSGTASALTRSWSVHRHLTLVTTVADAGSWQQCRVTPSNIWTLEAALTVRRVVLVALVAVLLAPAEAHASFLSPEAEDKLATFIALFVIFVVPVVLIVLFWMVHILPEKIAHKRHHPQFEAIRTLCLLSLVFGGLLWPLAWLWAYSKPVMHKLAYGTDKHDAGRGSTPARRRPPARREPARAAGAPGGERALRAPT